MTPAARRFHRNGLLFLLALATLLAAESAALDRVFARDLSSKVTRVYTQPGQRWDYVVLGSSVAAVGCDTDVLAEELGGTVANLGLSGSAYPEQCLVWEKFLERNQVGTLVCQVDSWGLTQGGYDCPFHAYYHAPFLDDPVVFRHVAEAFPLRAYAWRWVPFWKYAEFNTQFGYDRLVDVLHQPAAPATGLLRAQLITQPPQDEELDAPAPRDWTPSPERERALARILALARSRGIAVMVVEPPEYRTAYLRGGAERAAVSDAYERLAAGAGARYIRFGQDDPLARDRALYYNSAHLNAAGARRFSRELAQRLMLAR